MAELNSLLMNVRHTTRHDVELRLQSMTNRHSTINTVLGATVYMNQIGM